MPDPATFPVELTDYIFDYAAIINGNLDIDLLTNSCLVSRRWNAFAKPRLYTTWKFDSDSQPNKSLWKFLCSILRNSETASLVLSIDVCHWGWTNFTQYRDINFGATQEDIALVQQASRAAGIYQTQDDIVIALREGYRDPFVSILLAHLPNIANMSASTPQYDGFIGRVISQGLSDCYNKPPMQAFQNLKQLTVHGELAADMRKCFRAPRRPDQFKVNLEYLAPIFGLPQIEKISIFGLDIENSIHHYGTRAATSTLKSLIFLNRESSVANASDTQAILSMPKALASLTFHQIYYARLCVSAYSPIPVSNGQLFSAIQQHRESLEYLDIYRDYVGVSPPAHHKDTSHFGSLIEFKYLKELRIRPEALLGNDPWAPRAMLRSKDVLPAILVSLTLYKIDGQEPDPEMEKQFREILFSRDFPHLKSAVFEEVENLSSAK